MKAILCICLAVLGLVALACASSDSGDVDHAPVDAMPVDVATGDTDGPPPATAIDRGYVEAVISEWFSANGEEIAKDLLQEARNRGVFFFNEPPEDSEKQIATDLEVEIGDWSEDALNAVPATATFGTDFRSLEAKPDILGMSGSVTVLFDVETVFEGGLPIVNPDYAAALLCALFPGLGSDTPSCFDPVNP